MDYCEALGSQSLSTYRHDRGPKWFPAYAGQEVLLLDEFKPKETSEDRTDTTWPVQDFNRICDRFPTTLEIKGGNVSCNFRIVVICTNYNPLDWWTSESLPIRESFQRRISFAYEFDRDPITNEVLITEISPQENGHPIENLCEHRGQDALGRNLYTRRFLPIVNLMQFPQ